MKFGPDISSTAALIGDPARANILTALISGCALTATELANEAGVTKQTTSSHLAKLVDGGFLSVEKQGRHKYYRLANHQIAELIESLANVAAEIAPKRVRTGPKEPALRKARRCYDHLAGDLAVKIFDGFISQGLMIYAVPKFEQKSAKFQQAYAAFSGMLVDTYANIATVKLFSNPKHEDAESRQHFEATRSHFIGLQKVEVIINIGMIFIASLLIVGIVGFSVYLWQASAATLGLIATSIALSFRISSMAEWLMDGVSSLFGYLGSLRASLKIISQPLAIKDVANAPDIKLNGGAIELKNLHHHYGQDRGGLNGLSLSIKAGEKIGLVGKSGVGKSTLVNLILRFHQAEQGQILIDGQDVSLVKQDSLRLNFGMVMQDASLLHRSIADNIAYGARDITQAAIEAAAKKAHAHEFIMQLQDARGHKAYQVQVGERGVKLSGGQRQRIALARVILKNAPILILDEATSALDSEVEAEIQQSLSQIMRGKTVIAIAHRLSTIAQMDRIIVLHDGQVAEQGMHDELLKRGGIYAQLWAMQSGGYIGN